MSPEFPAISPHDVYVGGVAGILFYWVGRWHAEWIRKRNEREAEELVNQIIAASEKHVFME